MRDMSRWGRGGALGLRGLWVCEEVKAHFLFETSLTEAGWSANTRALARFLLPRAGITGLHQVQPFYLCADLTLVMCMWQPLH